MNYFKANWRRTKIVCTIGPATNSPALISALIRAGMNVARLNLAHGSLDEHRSCIQMVRAISQRLGTRVAILVDLPGPKYRTGKLENEQTILKKGDQITLTTRQVEGNAGLVSVNLSTLPQDVKVGDTVFLDDGALQLKVQEVYTRDVRCVVIIGGLLNNDRGLVVPGMRISSPFISDTMRTHIHFTKKQRPDYLAVSFVSNAKNVLDIKSLLKETDSDTLVIAKIERAEALKNFDNILEASDGIMVARGDLGLEIPLARVPLVQKEIIGKCNRRGKLVITATEMLESMIRSIRPTRAETTDVANAIFDGTDATMLSAETSIGKYPVESVRMMVRIARKTEKRLHYDQMLAERGTWLEQKTDEVISYIACQSARTLKAAAIVAFTQSGSTAGRISKYRPKAPILAMSSSSSVVGKLLLRWGVIPLQIAETSSIDELFTTAAKLCKQLGLARPGNLIIITGGTPLGHIGATNLLKVQYIV